MTHISMPLFCSLFNVWLKMLIYEAIPRAAGTTDSKIPAENQPKHR
ncbi:hypothetical protein DCCM_0843 [Desulfocucumis palustris]|uniref:Uncharacterized protein n=1 Tax=Desulfocucumis palustris TaxID=1898651 RepID=A0A2L2X8U0_9FIRM|nr:hypothetical protein DCCM_0843 [Desulfocucumis palustris]